MHKGGALAANPGSSPELAHALTSLHFSERNVLRREVSLYNTHEIETRVPLHTNVTLRAQANESAAACGMIVPYPLDTSLTTSTGEEFGYNYFKSQQKRDEKFSYAAAASLTHCPCNECAERRKECPCPR